MAELSFEKAKEIELGTIASEEFIGKDFNHGGLAKYRQIFIMQVSEYKSLKRNLGKYIFENSQTKSDTHGNEGVVYSVYTLITNDDYSYSEVIDLVELLIGRPTSGFSLRYQIK